MRIVVTGDFHGVLPEAVPECDLLIHVGDVGSTLFAEGPFADWLRSVPAGEIVGVIGNTDPDPGVLRRLPWNLLIDDTIVIDDVVIHGASFRNFEAPTLDAATVAFSKIDDDAQIVVSHKPPYGVADLAANGDHAGSCGLAGRLNELTQLKLVACGHIHEAYGIYARTAPNVVIANGAYAGVNKPLFLNLWFGSELYVTGTGQQVEVHERTQDCIDHGCLIHNPSDHPMRGFKTHWRQAGLFDVKPSHMERICPHGVGHPDPDGLAYTRRTHGDELADVLAIHGCDGCCDGSYPPQR